MIVLDSGWAACGARSVLFALVWNKLPLPDGRGENRLSRFCWKMLPSVGETRGRAKIGLPGLGDPEASPGPLERAKRERSFWRFCTVDRRSEDERVGMEGGVKDWGGAEENGESLSIVDSSMGSSVISGALSSSNILNSSVAIVAWILRLFAEGLPRDSWSRPMMPSLRFIGLGDLSYGSEFALRRFSARLSGGLGGNIGSVQTGVF